MRSSPPSSARSRRWSGSSPISKPTRSPPTPPTCRRASRRRKKEEAGRMILPAAPPELLGWSVSWRRVPQVDSTVQEEHAMAAARQEKTAQLYRMVMPDHLCPYGLKSKDLLERQGYDLEDHPLESREE